MLMDGCLSLVQLRLPVKVVVFNNGALDFIELEASFFGILLFGRSRVPPGSTCFRPQW
jgi:pyruvate dehydrogenase (quinone)